MAYLLDLLYTLDDTDLLEVSKVKLDVGQRSYSNGLAHVANSEASKRRIIGEGLDAPMKIVNDHRNRRGNVAYMGLEGTIFTMEASPFSSINTEEFKRIKHLIYRFQELGVILNRLARTAIWHMVSRQPWVLIRTSYRSC